MFKEGKTIPEIQDAIDKMFGPYYPYASEPSEAFKQYKARQGPYGER